MITDKGLKKEVIKTWEGTGEKNKSSRKSLSWIKF